MPKLPKWIKVRKTPSHWRSNYVVVLYPTTAKLSDRFTSRNVVVSHHNTKEVAEAKAQWLVKKYKTARRIWLDYLGWGR